MNISFPLKVEVRARAASRYNDQHIADRLAALRGLNTEAASNEIDFLEKLQKKRAASQQGS